MTDLFPRFGCLLKFYHPIAGQKLARKKPKMKTFYPGSPDRYHFKDVNDKSRVPVRPSSQ